MYLGVVRSVFRKCEEVAFGGYMERSRSRSGRRRDCPVEQAHENLFAKKERRGVEAGQRVRQWRHSGSWFLGFPPRGAIWGRASFEQHGVRCLLLPHSSVSTNTIARYIACLRGWSLAKTSIPRI